MPEKERIAPTARANHCPRCPSGVKRLNDGVPFPHLIRRLIRPIKRVFLLARANPSGV